MSFLGSPISFNKDTLELLKDDWIGVYVIYKRDKTIIYIGKGNIKERMQKHFAVDKPCILENEPYSWNYELTKNPGAMEKKLLEDNDTLCNERKG